MMNTNTLTSIDFLMTGGDGYNFDGHIEPVVIGEMKRYNY